MVVFGAIVKKPLPGTALTRPNRNGILGQTLCSCCFPTFVATRRSASADSRRRRPRLSGAEPYFVRLFSSLASIVEKRLRNVALRNSAGEFRLDDLRG